MGMPCGKLFARSDGAYMFHCPGCLELHTVWVERADPDTGIQHTFNRHGDTPTFSPSLLRDRGGLRCHAFIRDGFITFCEDSTHYLAGRTVSLPKWEN